MGAACEKIKTYCNDSTWTLDIHRKTKIGVFLKPFFATVDESVLAVEYKFSYTSNGVMARGSFSTPMTEDTIVEFGTVMKLLSLMNINSVWVTHPPKWPDCGSCDARSYQWPDKGVRNLYRKYAWSRGKRRKLTEMLSLININRMLIYNRDNIFLQRNTMSIFSLY